MRFPLKFLPSVACAILIITALKAGPALAQGGPPTIPGGPYGENESLASLRSYDQLVARDAAVGRRPATAWRRSTGRPGRATPAARCLTS